MQIKALAHSLITACKSVHQFIHFEYLNVHSNITLRLNTPTGPRVAGEWRARYPDISPLEQASRRRRSRHSFFSRWRKNDDRCHSICQSWREREGREGRTEGVWHFKKIKEGEKEWEENAGWRRTCDSDQSAKFSVRGCVNPGPRLPLVGRANPRMALKTDMYFIVFNGNPTE